MHLLLVSQLRTLSTLSPTIPTGETTLSEETLASLNQLKTLIQVCRDDELGHRDLAVQEDAQKALGHSVLSNLTQMGCKLAISIAKRI